MATLTTSTTERLLRLLPLLPLLRLLPPRAEDLFLSGVEPEDPLLSTRVHPKPPTLILMPYFL